MPATGIQRGVCVEAAGARLAGEIHLPPDPRGFVLFASSRELMRLDRRQLGLSAALNERGMGTLLFDLVETTDDAEVERNLEILTERLLEAAEWGSEQWGVEGLPMGFVGSGLGSAAALVVAAALGSEVWAISIHGGRPDLADHGLAKVQAPTLLLADPNDPVESQAADAAAARLCAPHRIRRRRTEAAELGTWQATPAICHWMEWYLEQHELLS
jgi:hypothetical protein